MLANKHYTLSIGAIENLARCISLIFIKYIHRSIQVLYDQLTVIMASIVAL